MRRIMSLCLAFPFVLACGPSGIVGIDNIRGRGPDAPRETDAGLPTVRVQVQGTVTAADGSPIAEASVEFRRCEVESVFHCTWGTVARTTTDVHGRYRLSYVHRKCSQLFQGLKTTAAGFLTDTFSGFDDGHITCTEELQTIDVQLTRLRT